MYIIIGLHKTKKKDEGGVGNTREPTQVPTPLHKKYK